MAADASRDATRDSDATTGSTVDFPADFVWGVATSAYQIEGSTTAEGRGRSIWDTFSTRPGAVAQGDSARITCDSYRRWQDDVALLADLGVGAYRFSVSWPRIQPDGHTIPNAPGIAYYDKLVDALCERGIAPMVTLYHWDLPQAIEDLGGWLSRDTAYRFAEYAAGMCAVLGDRVTHWVTLNEPFVHAALGYALGIHAPGKTLGRESFAAVHHQLLGHGFATEVLRAGGATSVGIAHSLSPVEPASDSPEDLLAATRFDALRNAMFCDPMFRGRYPSELLTLYPSAESSIMDDDLTKIAAPVDFLGVNYYAPTRIRSAVRGTGDGVTDDLPTMMCTAAEVDIPDVPHTSYGWPVVPGGLTDVLAMLRNRYGTELPPLYITENGASYEDTVVAGEVADHERIAYLEGHLAALRRAMANGADVRGYFHWSLLDNFEWHRGYRERFGLVHVDFASGRRTPKASYHYYRDRCRVVREER